MYIFLNQSLRVLMEKEKLMERRKLVESLELVFSISSDRSRLCSFKTFRPYHWYIRRERPNSYDGQDFVRQRISHTSRLVKVQGLWISWSVTQPRQVASGCYGKHTAKDLAPRCETRLEVCLRKQTRGRSLCFCLKFLTCRRITPWSDNAP